MRIVTCVKQVPDATGPRRFGEDGTTERTGGAVLSELDEYAVEQALRIAESHGDAEVVHLTMGPADSVDALRSALAMGGDRAVQVTDDALRGTDAIGTSAVLAAAIRRCGFDIVVCGMASTDGGMGVLPAMLAERLGAAQATMVNEITEVGADAVVVRRDDDLASFTVRAPLPAVLSVTDRSGEPRYPSLKNKLAARRRPVDVWTLADLGIDPSDVGPAAARATAESVEPRPPRQAGAVVPDDGDGGIKLAGFLTERSFV